MMFHTKNFVYLHLETEQHHRINNYHTNTWQRKRTKFSESKKTDKPIPLWQKY